MGAGTAPGPSALSAEQRISIMRDGIINYSGAFVSSLIGLVVVPIVLVRLGAEAYGLWIGLLLLASTAATFDFGLSYTLIRELAIGSAARSVESDDFVGIVGMMYLAIGLVGGMVTAAFGLQLSGVLNLSSGLQRISTPVCVLAGVFCFGQALLTFGNSVLHGVARFDVISKITIATAIVRAVSSVAVLWAGGRLLGFAVCQVGAGLIGAALTLGMTFRLRPDIAKSLTRRRWAALRQKVEFSILSQFARSINSLLLETSPALLVGGFLGSAAIVPLHIGQKFPVTAAQLGGSAAQVLFAHSGRHADTRERMQDFIRVGTHWMTVLTAGPVLILAIFAPPLLRAWIGEATTTTVLVLRISALDVLAVSLGEGAVNALWGLGSARAVVAVSCLVALPCLATMVVLIPAVGVVGASWGLLVATSLATLAFVQIAARKLFVSARGLMAGVFDGIMLPLLVAGGAAALFRYLVNPQTWPGVLAGVAAAGFVYFIMLSRSGARSEDAALIREVAGLPILLWRSVWARSRRSGLGAVASEQPLP